MGIVARRTLVVLAPLLVAACYQSHELGGLADLGSIPDMSSATCPSAARATIAFEPALPAGIYMVSFDSAEADPVAGTLRFQLNTCPDHDMPCPHTLVVGNVGDVWSGTAFVALGALGRLDWRSPDAARFRGTDTRRCASCGGTFEIIAGALPGGLDPATLTATTGPLECSMGCAEHDALTVSGYHTTVTARSGLTARSGSLTVRLSSPYEANCRHCDCTLPDADATGIVIVFTGAPIAP